MFQTINIIVIAALAYLLWIAPHLNSTTPLWDIYKSLFVHGIFLFITLSLLILPAVKWRRYASQHADVLASLQWKQTVPPAFVRAVLLLVLAVFGVALLGIMLSRLFGEWAALWFG